jgi:hypothetical protein
MGGGCVGGLTCPYNVSSAKDGGGRSTISGSEIAVGNKAPARLKHLTPHAKEALLSSGGQHGMSALSSVDASIDVVGTAAPPATGAMPSDTAIKAARNARMQVMIVNYRAMQG